jgi:iron complex transport system substrate-binding protein
MTRISLPRSIALAALVFAASACGRFADRDAHTDSPERIVSVSKQINEFIYAIGAERNLAAVDISSIYPPAIKSLPTVGYHRALSAEGIISVKPTRFLTDGNVGPDAVLEQLRQVGIPIEVMRPGGTVDSAQLLLTQLGAKFHRERAADSVLAEWRSGMTEIWRDTAQWAGQRRPRVLVIHFGQIANNYLAVNRGSAADQMIRWAGGENAIDSVGGMTRLTPELIARAAPDVIVATDLGFDRFGSAAQFASLPGVALTPAGKSGCINRIEETEIIYFGPRTPETVRKLRTMIHP